MIEDLDVRGWMRGGLGENINEEFVSMATFENAIRRRCLEVQRAVLEEVVQEAADKTALICPVCLSALAVVNRKQKSIM